MYYKPLPRKLEQGCASGDPVGHFPWKALVFHIKLCALKGGHCGIVAKTTTGWWFLATPLKNDGVRQLG